METLLTMSEAARYLGCSVSSIRNYTEHKGKYNLPCVRTVGQHRKIRQSDLDAFISKHSSLPDKTNTLVADELGFGDESEQELTLKNINFDSANTPSDELFRRQNEKANAVKAANADQEAKPTTGEILRKLKDWFDTSTEATNSVVEGTPVESVDI